MPDTIPTRTSRLCRHPMTPFRLFGNSVCLSISKRVILVLIRLNLNGSYLICTIFTSFFMKLLFAKFSVRRFLGAEVQPTSSAAELPVLWFLGQFGAYLGGEAGR